jgi:hypothetical protein
LTAYVIAASGGAGTVTGVAAAKKAGSAAGKLLRPKPEEPSALEQVQGYRPKQD